MQNNSNSKVCNRIVFNTMNFVRTGQKLTPLKIITDHAHLNEILVPFRVVLPNFQQAPPYTLSGLSERAGQNGKLTDFLPYLSASVLGNSLRNSSFFSRLYFLLPDRKRHSLRGKNWPRAVIDSRRLLVLTTQCALGLFR